jgi:hypothetical protein
MPDADLTAAVYDPPAPGLPHITVIFDPEGRVLAVRPVASIEDGEAAVAELALQLAGKLPQAA